MSTSTQEQHPSFEDITRPGSARLLQAAFTLSLLKTGRHDRALEFAANQVAKANEDLRMAYLEAIEEVIWKGEDQPEGDEDESLGELVLSDVQFQEVSQAIEGLQARQLAAIEQQTAQYLATAQAELAHMEAVEDALWASEEEENEAAMPRWGSDDPIESIIEEVQQMDMESASIC